MPEQDPPQSGNPSGGDETWPTYQPPASSPAPDVPEAAPPPESIGPTHVPYDDQDSYGTYPPPPDSSGSAGVFVSTDLVSTTSRGCGGIVAIIGLMTFVPVIIGIIFTIRALSGGFNELEDGLGSPFDGADAPNMQTTEGFNALVDAVREETGGTTVFEASLYGEYGSVYVPVDEASKRYYSFHFDGDLRKTGQGTTDYKRFDLSTLDPTVLANLFRKAETLVEDPTMTYVIIRAPAEHMNGAWFSVHASNDFMESGYFTADETGKVVFEYLPQ